MGASQAVELFDTKTGVVMQNYRPVADGLQRQLQRHRLFAGRQIPDVQPGQQQHRHRQGVADGGLIDYAQVSVPPNNSFIKCFPNSPIGDYGRSCGTFYSTGTSYPGGVAFSSDGKSAYALLNQNNTLTKIEMSLR